MSRYGPLAVTLLALAVFAGHAWLYHVYVNDDAYITYRYSYFLANGRGPYFNVDEHVEGYTSLLEMLFLSGVAWLASPTFIAPAAKAIGFLSGLWSVGCAALLARWLAATGCDLARETVAALIAGVALAASTSYALNTFNGLETTLYGALLISGVLAGEAAERGGSWRGSGILFAAALITRPEAALIFGSYWAAQMGASFRHPEGNAARRRLCLDAAVVSFVLLAQLLFRRFAYDGEWLPNTYYAKFGGFLGYDAWWYLKEGALKPLGGIPGACIALVGAALLGHTRERWIIVAIPTIAGLLSPLLVGLDWMPGQRFTAPYLPLACAIFASGIVGALHAVRIPGLARLGLALTLVTLIWISQESTRQILQMIVQVRARGFERGHMALADWLRERCAPGETVALTDIGLVGYQLPDQRVLDISGLTDRFIAKSRGPFLDKQYPVSYLLDQDPKYVVLVFLSPGDPEVVPAELNLRPLSATEQRIFDDPGFRQRYVRVREPDEKTGWLEQLAASFGAKIAFLHDHPGKYYVLVVFERLER